MDASDLIKRFHDFLESNYLKDLMENIRLGRKFLITDFNLMAEFDPDLAHELLEFPEETIKGAELAVQEIDQKQKIFRVRFKNLPKSQKMMIRNIRSEHIGRLFYLDGVVRQKSDVRPQMTSSKFECPSCGNIISILQLEKKFREPTTCGCGRKGKFKLISKELIDAQGIVMEEAAEDLDGGEQPKRVNVFLKEDLVSPLSEKHTNPGSKIIVCGIIKEVPIPSKDGGQLTRFDLIIEANYIEASQEDYYEIEITKEDEEKIKEIAYSEAYKKRIVQSIAPSIYGFEKVKEAIALQLVGGVKKVRTDGMITRGDMHVLLIGDPGAGKSQLLKRVSKIAPKARFVSGKGVSGAGLTASVVKDEFLNGWSLEAGALPLANKGFCIAGDSEILLADGNIKTIKEIYNKYSSKKQDISIQYLNTSNLKVELAKIINVSKRIPNKLLKLKFSTGETIKITPEHLLPTWNNKIEWKKVEDIKLGDHLIAPKKFNSYIKEESNELMEFLGMMITDGHLSKKKYILRYYTKDEQLKNRFIELVKNIFKKQCGTYIDKRSNIHQIYFCSKKIHKTIQEWGIKNGNKNKQKINLNKIYNLNNNNIMSFMIGVINGDGSISNRKTGGIIDIVSGNKDIVVQYQKLLRKIGIISNTLIMNSKGGGVVKKGNYTTYKVSITGIDNIKELNDTRLISRKYENLIKIISRKNTSSRIPKIQNIMSNIKTLLSDKSIFYKNSIKTSLLKAGLGISIHTIINIIPDLEKNNNINKTKELSILKNIINNNIIFPKITKIEEITVEEVYDLQTDTKTDPNFFANFIPVHNCMIDEMDKMSDEDRSAMHEALEGQTITISKANIQATLRTETTVLAAANPKLGRFDPYDIIAKQIDMPPALINRFDLIFAIKDLPSQERDTFMAEHILRLHQTPDVADPPIDTQLLKKYISYARQHCRPVLTDDALNEIKRFYVDMRNSGNSDSGPKAIPVSARQLEGLVRMSEAEAKLRLGTEVTKEDAIKAIEILKFSLEEVGLDPETGKIDIDRIASGITQSQRNKIHGIKEIIQELEVSLNTKNIPIEKIIELAKEKGISESQTEEYIEKLKKTGDLFEPRKGIISRI